MAAHRQTGFTIVELLIVVVVIAILAAVTLVAYNGIQAKSRTSAAYADLSSSARAIEAFRSKSNDGVSLPATLSEAGINGSTINYAHSTVDSSYCLSKIVSNQSYYVSNRSGVPGLGECGGMGLAAAWALDGSATDMVGTNNGTALNVVPAVGKTGQANSAYQFNGTNTEINLPLVSTATQNVTITAWIYVQADTKGAIFHVGSNNGGYSLGIGSMFATANRQLVILFPAIRWINTSTYLADGWHFVGLSLDASKVPTAYVDGAPVSGSPYTGSAPIAPTGLMVLGRNTGDDSTPATMRLLNTRLDDVRFYTAALSAAEVKGLYDAGL